jgi:hypothetical protein
VSLRIPVDGLLEDLGAEFEALVIERYAAPTVDALGDVAHGPPTEIETTAIVHQATRKQIERAGLDYGPDYRAFYARTELRTANTAHRPDVVVYAGQRWEIVDLADYAALAGLYLALGSLQA